MSVVVCKLPRAGLGNQLFPLMKAAVFAQINQMPLIVTGYHQFLLGPYLRREKSKRNYSGYFVFQKGIVRALLDEWKLNRMKLSPEEEPYVQVIVNNATDLRYQFTAMPHWNDYFVQLKEHRDLVIELFWKMLKDEIKKEVLKAEAPAIGVHIRKGDFRILKGNEDFRKVGAVRTPDQYFIDMITAIRKIHGTDIPVSVFSDGGRQEIDQLFKLNHVTLVEGNADLVDMLLLSRSKIIITSAGSTFSYWSGFLSNAPLIMHPDHIHKPIRFDRPMDKPFEGPWDHDDPVLIEQIKSIIKD